MSPSATLKVLSCLMLYATCAQAIMVKFGTNDGPIVPPTPEPSVPPPQPYRIPAPVWEERSNDTPDPNAQWRPRLFVSQPRYTQVVYNSPGALSQQPLNNAQKIANNYTPRHQTPDVPHEPIHAQPITNYFTPSQIVSQLSSQSLPGLGIRYFVPDYINAVQARKDEKLKQLDSKNNHIETNDINDFDNDYGSDQLWKQEKEAAKRVVRTSQEGVANYVYQWPAYVPRQY